MRSRYSTVKSEGARENVSANKLHRKRRSLTDGGDAGRIHKYHHDGRVEGAEIGITVAIHRKIGAMQPRAVGQRLEARSQHSEYL